MTELFGLTLNGDIPDGIPTNAVIIIEYLDEDGEPNLRVISTDMPTWARIGLLHAVLVGDHHDIINAFQDDEASDG